MKTPVLAVEEWDFATCPEAELRACLHYEYCREYLRDRQQLSSKIQAASAEDRLLRQQWENMMRGRHFFQNDLHRVPLMFSEFPTCPWLLIPAKRRTGIVGACTPHSGFAHEYPDLLANEMFDIVELVEEKKRRAQRGDKILGEFQQKHTAYWEEWHRQKNETGQEPPKNPPEIPDLSYYMEFPKHWFDVCDEFGYAVIKLDWSKSPRELHAAFGMLLKRRPKPSGATDDKIQRGGRGSASPRDRLKQLGAKRLLAHFNSVDKALESLESYSATASRKALYGSSEGIKGAARKAKQFLHEMQNSGGFDFLREVPKSS